VGDVIHESRFVMWQAGDFNSHTQAPQMEQESQPFNRSTTFRADPFAGMLTVAAALPLMYKAPASSDPERFRLVL